MADIDEDKENTQNKMRASFEIGSKHSQMMRITQRSLVFFLQINETQEKYFEIQNLQKKHLICQIQEQKRAFNYKEVPNNDEAHFFCNLKSIELEPNQTQ